MASAGSWRACILFARPVAVMSQHGWRLALRDARPAAFGNPAAAAKVFPEHGVEKAMTSAEYPPATAGLARHRRQPPRTAVGFAVVVRGGLSSSGWRWTAEHMVRQRGCRSIVFVASGAV